MKDLRQTIAYTKYMQSIGWQVGKIDKAYFYIRKVVLFGNVIKVQRVDLTQTVLNKIIKKYKPFQIIYEPLSTNGINPKIKLSHSPYLPTKTLQINLTKSEKGLLSQMHPKTRYNIKIARKNKLNITQSSDIKSFADFWSKNREGKGINLFSQRQNIQKLYKAFGKNALLLNISKNNAILSGILMPIAGSTAYYMYAASNTEGKNAHAPTLALWEVIKLAKKYKCKTLDFEGIYDERFPIESWKGFSKFKKTFGGKEIEYPGCFIKTDFLSFVK